MQKLLSKFVGVITLIAVSNSLAAVEKFDYWPAADYHASIPSIESVLGVQPWRGNYAACRCSSLF